MNWFEAARERFGGSGEYPLIDDDEIVEAKAVNDYWPWGYGSGGRNADELREMALRADHFDPSVRFVYLNLFYRLAHYPAEQVASVVEDQQDAASHREQFENDLQVLVRLVDVEQVKDAQEIRWEIVNACAVNDYGRALRLVGQLEALLPESTVHYHRGRLHFLIAVRNTWDGDLALEYWDPPLGDRPHGVRGMLQRILAAGLHIAAIQLHPTRTKLTEDDKDHLRDAIKHLEKAIDPSDVLPSKRFMLALSYACIGDGHNAARYYRWMVDNQQRFLAACAQEEGELWDDPVDADVFINGIHRCLVNAYDDAGELDNAINAANAWITACPDHLGTYERMARLYQQRGDFQATAEWLTKEVDRNPALGEDPNISIVLALGSIGTADSIDEALTKIANAHPHEQTIVESVVNSYWPAFARQAPASPHTVSRGWWGENSTLRSSPRSRIVQKTTQNSSPWMMKTASHSCNTSPAAPLSASDQCCGPLTSAGTTNTTALDVRTMAQREEPQALAAVRDCADGHDHEVQEP